MYVCICHGISDQRLREEVACGARRFEELQARTGVGTCCGACEPFARELVEQCGRRAPAPLSPAPLNAVTA
jgi:bacterioferritin-associated ferredoxin